MKPILFFLLFIKEALNLALFKYFFFIHMTIYKNLNCFFQEKFYIRSLFFEIDAHLLLTLTYP